MDWYENTYDLHCYVKSSGKWFRFICMAVYGIYGYIQPDILFIEFGYQCFIQRWLQILRWTWCWDTHSPVQILAFYTNWIFLQLQNNKITFDKTSFFKILLVNKMFKELKAWIQAEKNWEKGLSSVEYC